MLKNATVHQVRINQIKPYQNNAKIHGPDQIRKIADSIKEFGFLNPILLDSENMILCGHGRLEAARLLGMEEVPCLYADGLTEAQKRAYIIADNRLTEIAEWDFDILDAELAALEDVGFDISLTGFERQETTNPQQEKKKQAYETLKDRFLVSPFSVLDSRTFWWTTRKRSWKDIGIRSEIGRGNDGEVSKNGLTYANSHQSPAVYEKKNKYEELIGEKISWDEFLELFPESGAQASTSIFDPVLCEIAYRWYSKKGDRIIDPFAGGSVRGIVAALLGRQYTGVDLSERQIEANRANWAEISHEMILEEGGDGPDPLWIHGDSAKIDQLVDADGFDLLLTCPPYADLEKYSNDPNDLSNMEYSEFVKVYSEIIKKSVSKLKGDAFAICVVGDVRDKKGIYRNFVGDTIQAFKSAGMGLYNECIVVTSNGAAATVASKPFKASRKLGKIHQNYLIFEFDGDMEAIALDDADDQERETSQFMEKTSGKFAVNHKKALTFVKGDPKKISSELGDVDAGTRDDFTVEIGEL